MMKSLQERGAHNINIVTGSHVVPQFLAGIYIAKFAPSPSPSPSRGEGKGGGGFNLPIVWNSSGYDGLESLKLLDGVVDIYMPDIKYSSNDVAEHYSAATNYWDVVRPVIKEMHRQVGDLKIGEDGLAVRGLLIRHLLLPGNGAGTEKALKFISEEISNKTYISLMSQYFPTHKAVNHPVLGRQITKQEWKVAEKLLQKYGLENGWVQFPK